MSAASVLTRGRAAAERLMVDTCTIRRKTGETTGPGGVVTPTYSTLYAGKCRFQQPAAQASQEDSGEDYLLMLRLDVQLPMSVTGLETEDEITCDTSAHDPDLPARVFVVRDLAHKTQATSRRVGVVERS
ncbi:DUF6093 family protein [Micromonosporaceae bacterium B7E4]